MQAFYSSLIGITFEQLDLCLERAVYLLPGSASIYRGRWYYRNDDIGRALWVEVLNSKATGAVIVTIVCPRGKLSPSDTKIINTLLNDYVWTTIVKQVHRPGLLGRFLGHNKGYTKITLVEIV